LANLRKNDIEFFLSESVKSISLFQPQEILDGMTLCDFLLKDPNILKLKVEATINETQEEQICLLTSMNQRIKD